MARNLHVCTKYQIEYDVEGHFCGLGENVNELFLNECDGAYTLVECEDIPHDDWVFVPKKEVAALMGRFANQEEAAKLIETYSLNRHKGCDMVTILAKLIANSDPANDFVVMAWF